MRAVRVHEKASRAVDLDEIRKQLDVPNPDFDAAINAALQLLMAGLDLRMEHIRLLLMLAEATERRGATGYEAAALNILTHAYVKAEEIGAPRLVVPVVCRLAAAHARCGDTSRAQALLAEVAQRWAWANRSQEFTNAQMVIVTPRQVAA